MNPIGAVSRNVEILITNIDHLEDTVFDTKSKEFIPLVDKWDLETKYKSAEFVKGYDIFPCYQTFIEENAGKIAPDKLKILDLSLENRISHLKGQMMGVTGFFRTLLFAHWSDETISTFQHLELLDQFIKDKIQRQGPDAGMVRLKEAKRDIQPHLAPISHPEPLSERSSETSSVASDDEPLDISSDMEKEIPLPESKPEPAEAAEANQTTVAPPKIAAPPPPPLKMAKISEPKIPQEPAQEPSFNKNVDRSKSPMQTATEMLSIQRYTVDLESALKSARNDFNELKTLKTQLDEGNVRLNDVKSELKEREDTLKFLKVAKRKDGILWQLKVNKRTGEKKKVPFYEEEKFKKRNEERKARNEPPLPNKYRIDNAIQFDQAIIDSLQADLQKEQKNVEELTKKIKWIEVKYQSAFDQKNLPNVDKDKSRIELLDALLKKKELKLHQWKTSYQNMENYLLNKEKQKVVVAEPKKQQIVHEPEWDDLKNLNPVDAAFFAKRDDLALNLIAPDKYEADPDLLKQYEKQDTRQKG